MDTAKQISEGLQRISTALKTQAWRGAEASDLTPLQGQILAMLRDRSLRLNEVAENLGIKPSTASESVRVLVDKGLVKKERTVEDNRAIAITLTQRGKGYAERSVEWSGFLLEAIETLSDDDQATLQSVLGKLLDALKAGSDVQEG